MRKVFVVAVLLFSSQVFAQASGVQFSNVVCGPSGLSGVTYVLVSGHNALCGVDSSGASLMLQVSTLSPDVPVDGGEQVGLDVGAAMLLVMAAAWAIRAVRRLIDSGGDGA
jgi:hypothetical protein